MKTAGRVKQWWMPRLVRRLPLSVVRKMDWRECRCLFVLSTGRVGTESLTHLLGLSPAIDAHHEPVPQLIAERKAAYLELDEHPDKFRRIFVNARVRSLAEDALEDQLRAETSARMTFFAPVIAEVLPNARFLYVHRHPGDVVRSGMRRSWYCSNENDADRLVPRQEDPAAKEWSAWQPFEKICWYWKAYNEFILSFRESLDARRSLTVSFDELWRRGTDGASQLFSFLQLEVPSEDQLARVLGVRHNQQVRNDFPRFAEWSEDQKATLYRIAGATMMKLKYEVPAELNG